MKNLAPEHVVPDPPRYEKCLKRRARLKHGASTNARLHECKQEYTTVERQALQFLIASRWTLAEASALGLSAKSNTDEPPFVHNELSVGSSTKADVEFQIRVESASASLARPLERVGSVTEKQIRRYYASHRRELARPERYMFEIWEPFPDATTAAREMKRLRAGASISGSAYIQYLDAGDPTTLSPVRRAFVTALLSARLHTLVGPVPLLGHYAFFELQHVLPPIATPLSRARSAIAQKLKEGQRRSKLVPYIAAWRSRWIPRTDCSPGYIVQKCAEYRGAKMPENPIAFD